MWRVCVLWITILAACCCRASAQTESDRAIKERIAALEQSWCNAVKAGDTRAVSDILDDRVLLVNDDGSVQTKGDFLAAMKQGFSLPREQQFQILSFSLNIKIFGGTAIAIGNMWVKGVAHGRPYRRHERFLDTWKNHKGTWIIVGTQATPLLH